MANPEVVTLPEYTWVKVATSTRGIHVTRVNSTVLYYKTYRNTEEPAPDPIVDGELPKEAVRIFELSNEEFIKSSDAIDVYIVCVNNHRTANADIGYVVVGPLYNSVDTYLQDQTSRLVDRFLTIKIQDVTLAVPASVDSRTLTLEPGHGFTANSMIEIDEGNKNYQSRVISVVGDVITVSSPFPVPFTVAANAKRVSPDMNVVGSATDPITFYQKPPDGIQWDINILSINIRDNAAMNDTTFGGIPALTNGVVFRTMNGDAQCIFTAIDNGCIIRHCDTDNPFTGTTPAGQFALNAKRRFNGQQGDGVARRIVGENVSGRTPSEFQAIVADDLSELSRFWCVIRGHVVDP